MSIYDHLQSKKSDRGKQTCSSCSKIFSLSIESDHYPGNKMTEFIECPYCGEKNGSVRTSGFVFTSKVDE